MNLSPLDAADRIAADVFGKSYREFLELKPTHYRWSRLAPQSLAWLREAHDHNWSCEKIADYLHCDVGEAEGCLRRYIVSSKVNSMDSEADKLRQALAEWIGVQPGMEDLGAAGKRKRAGELAIIVANHLFAALRSGEDIMKMSRELEGDAHGETPLDGKAGTGGKESDPGPKWGPQWKD